MLKFLRKCARIILADTRGVALVGDPRTGDTVGAVSELNKLQRQEWEMTNAIQHSEYKRAMAEYELRKTKLELDGLRLKLLDLRQQYVTVRDEYSRGDRKMTYADRMEQIPAGRVLGGPIGAYNQVIGDLYTILQK